MPEMRYREALNLALREEMTADRNVFLMGEDVGVFNGAFKVTDGLLKEFGEDRVRDTPISENTHCLTANLRDGSVSSILSSGRRNWSDLMMDQ